MAPAATAAPARKRIRKRKRRRDISSSESSELSESGSDTQDDPPVATLATTKNSKPSASSSDSSSESSDVSSDDSDSDIPMHLAKDVQTFPVKESVLPPSKTRVEAPPVPPTPLPSLLPKTIATSDDAEKEQKLKDKFRKFWMSSMADGFADDLNEVRKEPGLNNTRLELLIDSLASGTSIYSSSTVNGSSEMEMVLGSRK